MIKRSFSENATQALLPEHEQKIRLSEADLAKVKRESCDVCDKDVEDCHEQSMEYERASGDLYLSLLASPAGRRMFAPKRLVVYRKVGLPPSMDVILLTYFGRTAYARLVCCFVKARQEARDLLYRF
jgi:superfamily II RNA helicase